MHIVQLNDTLPFSVSLSLSHFYCIEEWTKSRTKLFVCILEMSKKMNIRTFVYLLDDGLAGKMPQPLHLALERFTLVNKQCRKRKKRDLSIRFLCIFEGLEPFCRFIQKNCVFVTAPESSDSNKNTTNTKKIGIVKREKKRDLRTEAKKYVDTKN